MHPSFEAIVLCNMALVRRVGNPVTGPPRAEMAVWKERMTEAQDADL